MPVRRVIGFDDQDDSGNSASTATINGETRTLPPEYAQDTVGVFADTGHIREFRGGRWQLSQHHVIVHAGNVTVTASDSSATPYAIVPNATWPYPFNQNDLIIVETNGLFGNGYALIDHDAWPITGAHMNQLPAITAGGTAQNPTYDGDEVRRNCINLTTDSRQISTTGIVSGRQSRWINLARGEDDEILIAASDGGTFALFIVLIMAD